MLRNMARTGQATGGNIIRRRKGGICISADQGKNTDTLIICNPCCFSMATMVMRTRHNVTLCVHCDVVIGGDVFIQLGYLMFSL